MFEKAWKHKEILGTEQLGKLTRGLEEIKVGSQLCKRGLNSFIDEKSMKLITWSKQKFYSSEPNIVR